MAYPNLPHFDDRDYSHMKMREQQRRHEAEMCRLGWREGPAIEWKEDLPTKAVAPQKAAPASLNTKLLLTKG